MSPAAASASFIAKILGVTDPQVNQGMLAFLLAIIPLWWMNNFRNRRLTTQVNGELRKEFIEEMHRLTNEVVGLRGDNEGLRREVRGLRAENDNLRIEVRQMHGVIDGLRRQTQGAALSAQRVVADGFGRMPLSPEMEQALERLDQIIPTTGTDTTTGQMMKDGE